MYARTPSDIPFSGPFTRAEALDHGLTIGALRALERNGVVERIQRGLYVRTGDTDPLVAGLRLLPPHFVIGFEAAAILHALPTPWPKALQTVDAYAPGKAPRSTSENALLRLHYTPLPAEQVTAVNDRLITTIARTAIDVTCRAGLLNSLVTLDAALRRGASYDELWAARKLRNGFRGAAKLNWAIAHANPLSESANESISRCAMLRVSLPQPILQAPLLGDNGVRYFADFYWPEKRLIGEADGAMKYQTPAALFDEKRREDALRAAGYNFVRWTWSEVFPNPQVMLSKLSEHLR